MESKEVDKGESPEDNLSDVDPYEVFEGLASGED